MPNFETNNLKNGITTGRLRDNRVPFILLAQFWHLAGTKIPIWGIDKILGKKLTTRSFFPHPILVEIINTKGAIEIEILC